MPKPILVFTKKKNSFTIYVKNMEQLNVVQIQKLEAFVKIRNGLFDFEKYEFSINKNIEFFEFVSLVEHVQLDAICEENIVYSKNQPRISFGQYKGMQICDLDDTYLIWLKGNYRGEQRALIDNEIASRGL